MNRSQLFLILCLCWFGNTLARSVQRRPHNYGYTEGVRTFPQVYRGRNDDELDQQQRPTIQSYWQNFVRSIPFRFNMTNPIGNLFSAGSQEVIQSPAEIHQDEEPNRNRRKSNKRKSSTKKSKTRRKTNARKHSRYYTYGHIPSDYRQLQLQPIGMGAGNAMHFYDPNTGNYYALQLVSSPAQYYSPGHTAYDSKTEDDDDSYYSEDDNDARVHNLNGLDEDAEDAGHDDYDNIDYSAIAEAVAETGNDYADDIQIVDTDEDIFGDRKFKDENRKLQSLKRKLSLRVVSLPNPSKTAMEEDMMNLSMDYNQKPGVKGTIPVNVETEINSTENRVKPSKTSEDVNAESVRSVLGTFMKDDAANRKRQSTTRKVSKQRLVERPRYYIYPHYLL